MCLCVCAHLLVFLYVCLSISLALSVSLILICVLFFLHSSFISGLHEGFMLHVPCGEGWWEPREMSPCEGDRDRLSLSEPGPNCQLLCRLSSEVKERTDGVKKRGRVNVQHT